MARYPITFQTVQSVLEKGKNLPSTSDFDLNDGDWPLGKQQRPASVLIPLVQRQNQINLILTKRASSLRHHPGQIAFPGGKVDGSDKDTESAALREAQEEIGLQPEHVRVLGGLPNHITVTNFDVHVFVAEVNPAFVPRPEAGEVDEIFEVPLAHVLKRENYLVEGRIWQGKMRHYFVVPFGPYYIWGATARMLRMFAEQVENNHAD